MVAGKMWKVKPRKVVRRRRMPFNKKQLKAIKKIANHSGEIKYKDATASSINPFSGSPATLLSTWLNLAQGVDNDERVGDSVRLRNILLRLKVKNNTTSSKYLRFLVIQVRGDTAPSNMPPNQSEPFLPKAENVGEPYRKLVDKKIMLSSTAGGIDKVLLSFNIKKFLSPIIKFDDAATTVNQGQIYFYLIADTDTSTGNISATLYSRTNYYDA